MKMPHHKVMNVRPLAASTFVLRLERGDMAFRPGQFLNLGRPDESHRREYSIYSAPGDPFLEVLIREIPEGHVSPQLARLHPGAPVSVDGPHGQFLIDESLLLKKSFTLIATGTGISPLHCFVKSYAPMDYHLLHGVRSASECYDRSTYASDRYHPCISRENGDDFRGRVTDYIQIHPPDRRSLFYLCGNADMIYEVFELLRRQGVTREQVFTEVYF